MKSIRTKERIRWFESMGWIYGVPPKIPGSFLAMVDGYPWPVWCFQHPMGHIVYTQIAAEADGSDYWFENETCKPEEIVFYKIIENYPNKSDLYVGVK